MAGQHLQHPMPRTQHVPPHIVPARQEIPHRLLGLVGHVDRGQLPRPEEADQLGGIPPSVLIRCPGRRGVKAGAIT